ncbi:MAG TPA: potassium channel family protein [Blastocatellia bacterium]|nr:potassium channel family protein [Blastocatellia bacterium]
MFYTILGVGLLALVAYDVYVTILHAAGKSGPVSERLTRLIWRVSQRIAFRLSRARRHRMLNAVGPLLMPGILLVSVVLLIVGYALVYFPRMPGQFTIAGDLNISPWLASLYFSGTTLTTIGYGDIAPRSLELRFTALAEGASGLILISLTISYLVSVYQALERKRVTALSFYHHAEGGADAVGFIAHHFVSGRFIGIQSNMRTAARNLQEVLESHIEHPIIHYFHPLQVYKGVPRVLFLSLEIFTVIRACLDKEEYEDLYDHPDVKTLGTSAMHVLGDFANLLRLAVPSRPGRATYEESFRWRGRFERTLSRLEEAGIRTEKDKQLAWETYQNQRSEWESSLFRFALYLGYDWDEVTGDRDLRIASDELNEASTINQFQKASPD